jgi:ribosomal protein L5
LKEHFDYKNIHQVPVIEKIVINCGVGRADSERKQAVQDALDAISLITGQRGVATISKNSISNFKLRAGELVGAKVTLRGDRMFEFLLRLIGTAIPVYVTLEEFHRKRLMVEEIILWELMITPYSQKSNLIKYKDSLGLMCAS